MRGILGLHHVAILTSDIEAKTRHLTCLFGGHARPIVDIESSGLALRSTMITFSDGFGAIQLIEPRIGPGVFELATFGEGTIYEIALETENADEFAHESSLRRLSLDGKDLGRSVKIAASGSKYFYLDSGQTGGTRFEIIEPQR